MNLNQVKPGLKVRIVALNSTRGFAIRQEYINNRRLGALGIIKGFVGGHGGDVWWVEHDGTVAPYCFDEFAPA